LEFRENENGHFTRSRSDKTLVGNTYDEIIPDDDLSRTEIERDQSSNSGNNVGDDRVYEPMQQECAEHDSKDDD
jgi:hypothetical protein